MLVSVGSDTLCRRGGLVALSITDLTTREDGRYSVLIRRGTRTAPKVLVEPRMSPPVSASWLIDGPLPPAQPEGRCSVRSIGTGH